jgi:hypothetical protein
MTIDIRGIDHSSIGCEGHSVVAIAGSTAKVSWRSLPAPSVAVDMKEETSLCTVTSALESAVRLTPKYRFRS